MGADDGSRRIGRRLVAAGMAVSLILAGCTVGVTASPSSGGPASAGASSVGPSKGASATPTQQRATQRVTAETSPEWTDPQPYDRPIVPLPAARCTRSDLDAIPSYPADAKVSLAPDPSIEAALPRTILGQRTQTMSTHGDTPALREQPIGLAAMIAACLHAPYAGISVGLAFGVDPTGQSGDRGTMLVEAVRIAGQSGATLEKGFYGVFVAEGGTPSGYEGSVGARTYRLFTPGSSSPTVGSYANVNTLYLIYFFTPCCAGAPGPSPSVSASPTPRPPSLERIVRDVVAQVP